MVHAVWLTAAVNAWLLQVDDGHLLYMPSVCMVHVRKCSHTFRNMHKFFRHIDGLSQG